MFEIATTIALLCLSGDVDEGPKITRVSGPTRVDGAPLWLFAVDDGSRLPAVSAERNQAIIVGRIDLKNPGRRIRWQTVADSRDTGGKRIADHWHIFAHGAHWISFSTSRARTSFLLKLDKRFKRRGLWKVADDERWGPGLRAGVPTNDHLLVGEPTGVAVGHFLPGYGTRLFRFDTNGRLREKLDVGGGKYRHGNGSSGYAVDGGFVLLASESLNMVAQGGVYRIKLDRKWKPRSAKLILNEDRTNVAMPSGVRLKSGYWIVHARANSGAYPRGQRPPPPPKGQKGLAPDDGAIIRYILSPRGTVLSRTVLVKERGNRPHTELIGRLLITTWDGGGGSWIRIDRVER